MTYILMIFKTTKDMVNTTKENKITEETDELVL